MSMRMLSATAMTAALLASPPSFGQVASALLQEGGALPGAPGETVTDISNTSVNHVGGYAATIASTDGVTPLRHIWGSASGGPGTVLRTLATLGTLQQDTLENFHGFSDTGNACYSSSLTDLDSGTSSLDSVWLDDVPLLVEEDPVGAFPGYFSSFNSRPGVTAKGVPYWVGGLTGTQGGATEFRAIFYSAAAFPVIAGGDSIGGVVEPVASGSAAIDFDFRFSALGTNGIDVVGVVASSTEDGVVVINSSAATAGGSILREASPVPASIGGLAGENWDNFDFFGITESGVEMVTGDTDAATGVDEFVLVGGAIVLREGDTVSSDLGFVPVNGSIEGAYLNENGDWAVTWDVDIPAGNVEALLLNGTVVLLEGDAVDWNNDGVIDAGDSGATLADFTGITALTLSDRDAMNVVTLFFTADVDIGGMLFEGLFRLPVQAAPPPPPCTDDGFESNGSDGTDDSCFGTELGAVPVGPQAHLHCDEDWVWFPATEGKTYVIETSNLIGGADTTLSVQKACGQQIAFDDDGGAGPASRLEWTAATSGFFDVRIGEYAELYFSGEGYDIAVSEICPIDMALFNQTVSSAVNFVADNDITTGPSFVVDAGGSASLTAGGSVILGSGTTVVGDLTVTLTPSPCP